MLQGTTKPKNKTTAEHKLEVRQSLTLSSSPGYEDNLINMNLNKTGTFCEQRQFKKYLSSQTAYSFTYCIIKDLQQNIAKEWREGTSLFCTWS